MSCILLWTGIGTQQTRAYTDTYVLLSLNLLVLQVWANEFGEDTSLVEWIWDAIAEV